MSATTTTPAAPEYKCCICKKIHATAEAEDECCRCTCVDSDVDCDHKRDCMCGEKARESTRTCPLHGGEISDSD